MPQASEALPTLHHAASSYYSAIARLALIEAGISFKSVPIDIHRRKGQLQPDYARLNPNMTVPTLVVSDRVIAESRDIVAFAFGERVAHETTRRWLDAQYAFPVEELTFGNFLRRNPLARRLIPKSLGGMEAQLRKLAEEHPDLRDRYLARAEVFAARRRTFDPAAATALFEERRRDALALLDALDAAFADGRDVLVPPAYGPADVVWTVFAARMRFVGMGDEVERRPALARWTLAMFNRPSFVLADVWDRIKVLGMLKQFFGG